MRIPAVIFTLVTLLLAAHTLIANATNDKGLRAGAKLQENANAATGNEDTPKPYRGKHCEMQLNISCGRSVHHEDCPDGYECLIDAVDRFAVCCGTDTTSTETAQEMSLMRMKMDTSNVEEPVIRVKHVTGEAEIEKETSSDVLEERDETQPHRGAYCENQLDITCGKSVNHTDCPTGYECVIGKTDSYAVCCDIGSNDNPPEITPSASLMRMKEKRQQPSEALETVKSKMKESESVSEKEDKPKPYRGKHCEMQLDIFCGRGLNREDCPEGYQCLIDSVDRFAVCCGAVTEPPPEATVLKKMETVSVVIQEEREVNVNEMQKETDKGR